MQKYSATISFIVPYLQARFSEQSRENLTKITRKSITEGIGAEKDDWQKFLYKDKKGCYVPSEQVEASLGNSAKDFKVKARRSNMRNLVKSSLFVTPEKIYLNKETPDSTLTSYPQRKDGSRVVLTHPVFQAGTEISFEIECLDEGIDKEMLKELLINAGRRYGLGARRPKFGRFEVIKVE